jgi:alanine-glyoxylate transaminase/(R)-3-amino-2-methylpropionate-pyruvate transaminase
VLQSNTSGKIAAFIAEPVMGVGGIIPLPEGYMKNIFERVRRYGGLCISDEVQTGFGRIGKDMWGFKWQGVKPDIITVAKAIGNGLPFGAVITRK